jgi:hypothetical protein
MTAIALRGYSLLKSSFITAFAAWMIGHMKAVGKAVELSRSMSANEHLARMLLPEYKEHTYYSLLAELNRKSMESIYGK